jgi:toxin ParE1/3/4
MAKQIVWDIKAEDDLRDIYNALLDISENYADAVVEAIFEGVDLIEKFPFLGRINPELNLPSIRELIIQKYRIVYFVSDAPEIRVIAVRHSGRPFNR